MNKNNVILSRKDREKVKRKNDIIKAAQKIFAQKSYEKATLDEIAKEAEYGKGTIYNYFKGKEDLFINLIQHGLSQMEENITKVISENMNCREQLEKILIEVKKFYKKNSDFFRVQIKEYGRLVLYKDGDFKENLMKSYHFMVNGISGILKRGIENSEIRNINTDKSAEFFIFMIRGLIWRNLCFNIKNISDEDLNLLISLFFDGISCKKKISVNSLRCVYKNK
jgi:AcrR family transcriptional regulator